MIGGEFATLKEACKSDTASCIDIEIRGGNMLEESCEDGQGDGLLGFAVRLSVIALDARMSRWTTGDSQALKGRSVSTWSEQRWVR